MKSKPCHVTSAHLTFNEFCGTSKKLQEALQISKSEVGN